jgi:hypothetical protein
MQKEQIHSACGIPVTDIEIETIRAVLETPNAYWRKLRDWLKASPDPDMQTDLHLITMLCRTKSFYPVERQALKILHLKDRAEAAGFRAQKSQTRRKTVKNSSEESADMPDTDRDINMQNDSQAHWQTFDFSTPEAIEKQGFSGKIKVAEWVTRDKRFPSHAKGIYLIVWNEQKLVQFDEIGTGSHRMGDPNVPIETLEESWIPESCVLYIGKAGGKKGLKERLRAYVGFGNGKSYSHWGGRYIWQLRERGELLIYWKELPNEEPRDVEKLLLREFENKYDGRLPFANING